MKKFLATTTIVLTLFSASAFAEVDSDEPSLQFDGAALYRQHCSRCHAPLERTLIPDRSARRIRSAINTMGSMGKQRELSPPQIEAIAQVLKSDDW